MRSTRNLTSSRCPLLAVAPLVAGLDYAFAAARLRSHIFLLAASIAALPAALNFLLALGAGAGAVFFVIAALAALAFFKFAASFALAAADSFRFAFGAGAGAGASASPFIFAHRAFWANAIFRRAAALNFLRVPGVASGVVAVSAGPP